MNHLERTSSPFEVALNVDRKFRRPDPLKPTANTPFRGICGCGQTGKQDEYHDHLLHNHNTPAQIVDQGEFGGQVPYDEANHGLVDIFYNEGDEIPFITRLLHANGIQGKAIHDHKGPRIGPGGVEYRIE